MSDTSLRDALARAVGIDADDDVRAVLQLFKSRPEVLEAVRHVIVGDGPADQAPATPDTAAGPGTPSYGLNSPQLTRSLVMALGENTTIDADLDPQGLGLLTKGN